MQQETLIDLRNAIAVLRKGGLILYPTDTIWGIGCDATNRDAVERVYRLKRRSDSKALITLVDSADSVWNAVENVPEVAGQLIEAAVVPTTIIYDHASPLIAPNAAADDGSIAVRVTHEEFSNRLCREFKRPLISTSANVSGHPSPRCFSEIEKEIIEGVDYVVSYRQGDTSKASPSSIIKISDDLTFKIIR